MKGNLVITSSNSLYFATQINVQSTASPL